jgi:hypothetical protein
MPRRSHSYLVALGLLALASTPALAQRGRFRDHDDDCNRRQDRMETVCDERDFGWRGGGPVSVDAGPNGGVTVVGWDRDSVDVMITVHARARTVEEARDLIAEVRVERSGGTLRATGPASRSRASWWVRYDLYVPRRTDLTLETINGPVSVEDVSGVMRLDTENGPITLANIGGDVRARLDNGPLTVTLEGTEWSGEGLDASTTNGPVTLRVPEGYNAQLETGTVNGPMSLGFPITVQGRFGAGHQRIQTTLGRGGRPIRVVTTNGPAIIARSR